VCLRDEAGQPLDHLRFEFRFEAPWKSAGTGRHSFEFRESNYLLQEGRIALSLQAEMPVELESKTEPDQVLRERAVQVQEPGDDARLRHAAATFHVTASDGPAPAVALQYLPEAGPAPTSLLGLLLDSRRGFWVLWLLAAGFGAVHALTPGHGKTLVAAYLVGERGTIAHAVVLGLVTTLTHTGAVLALAAGLFALYPDTVPALVRTVLGVGGGLLVAGMGLWLLLRRLAGGADHIHLGGGAHHHHRVGQQLHARSPETTGSVPQGGWWGLVVLGISGGIVPCWDAIAMFGFGVSAQRVGLALQLLLAFSAGLAAILVVIGILVVRVKGFAGSRWGDSRPFRALPLVSAALVTALGIWLCYDSLQEAPAAAQSATVAPHAR
jgi:ABC-type nickel/cobalt efflux system permease component RcnA